LWRRCKVAASSSQWLVTDGVSTVHVNPKTFSTGANGGTVMNTQTTIPENKGSTQRFRLTGEEAMAQIQRLVHEGSVRRVIVKHPDGHAIVEFPLLVGVVGAALVPVWAALGAVVALVTDCTIEVEKQA
jgi:hypothetical protein